jgi:hypothetical protein
MRTFMMILTCLLLWLPINATCIIILLKNNTFYVGADSRSVITDYTSGKPTIKFKKIKKIHVTNSVYYAIAGKDDVLLTSTAEFYLKKKLPLDQKLKGFTDSMSRRYGIILQFLLQNDKQEYNKWIKENLAELSFFGYSNNKAFIETFAFVPYQGGVLVQNAKDTELRRLGLHEHDYVASNGVDLTAYKQVIIDMIDNERKFHKERIAKPYDFLTLSTKGAKWEVIK